MDKSVAVITIKDYGKIDIRLKDILDSRGLTRNYLARASNTRFEVIDRWYANKVGKA